MNKDLILELEEFLKKLKTDKKTIVINSGYSNNKLRGLKTKDDIGEGEEGIIIKKSDVLEVGRLRFLSILIIKDIKEKIEIYESLEDELVYMYSNKFFFCTNSTFKEATDNISIKSLDSNEIYLYSDLMGQYFNEILTKNTLTENPIKELKELIKNLTIYEKFFFLLMFISMIKKEPYKNSQTESIKEIKNLADLVNYIVNSEYEESYYDLDSQHAKGLRESLIQETRGFQKWIKQGYLNLEQLEDMLYTYEIALKRLN